MASIKNSLCLVIDLEGFFVQKKFQVYSWNDHFGRHAFFQPAALKDLSHKDKKTVNFAKHKYTDSLSNLVTERELMSKMKQILSYCDCTIDTWWYMMMIHDFKTLGCPKYDQLKQTIVEPLASCGFHFNDNNFIHYCPMTECDTFWLWFQTCVM